MDKEKVFPQGIIFKLPEGKVKEKCPWIKGRLSFKVDEFIEFLKKHNNNGWINLDIKKSKEDKMYLELDTWKPTPKTSDLPPVDYPENNLVDSPF